MGGQENRDRIVAELGKLGDADAQGAPSGGFAFTESDIRRVIDNWLDIAFSFDESISEVHAATIIDGPGLDYASGSFTEKANGSGAALQQHLERGKEYSVNQAQLAQNALDDYLGVEHRNVMEIHKARHGQETEV